MELKLTNLHWLPDMADGYDRCAHGSVYLRLGDKIVSDGESARIRSKHIFDDGGSEIVNFEEWRRQVCNFSDEISSLYQASLPKISNDPEEQKGFDLFMTKWKQYREEANTY